MDCELTLPSAPPMEPPKMTTSPCSDTKEHIYCIPEKKIKSPLDVALWEKSEAYYEIIGFINAISVSIQGKKLTDEIESSEYVQKLLNMFVKLNEMIDETPAIEQPQRFGNMAYREWFQKMKDNSVDYLQNVIPEDRYRAVPELAVYYTESFGNATRIDYGTGHELSFAMFLCCLFKIEVLKESDKAAVGLKVFNAYLNFVRKLQKTYRMEPAGSHGVWSLDDYQFIPFIWGSAQLAVKSPIEPVQFVDENIILKYKTQYMFISCIDYISSVKTGLFAEHSNQLWSISAVQSWNKINSGLVKMYQKEILSKFPVIQHIMFGSLLTLTSVKPGTLLPNARLGFIPKAPGSGDNKI